MTNLQYIQIVLELWGGVFCLIASICAFIEKDMNPKESKGVISIQVCNAMLLFCDALSWIFRGDESVLGFYMVRVSNYFVFALGYVLLAIVTAYISQTIAQSKTKVDKYIINTIYFICVAAILVLTVSQFTHFYYDFDATNHYYRKNLHWLSLAFGIVGQILNAVLTFRHRKNLHRMRYIAFLSYLFLPVLAMIIQIAVYGISLLNLFITISVLLMFVESLFWNAKRVIEQEKKMVQKEKELNEAKINTLMSQIQPHFLFNSLTTIRHLCRKNPEEAIAAIDEFTAFLRGNTEAINRKTCIRFQQELELVNNYLHLEKMRFGDKLMITYDIQADDFLLPALSVQPLVENAVKHGIMGKMDGGVIHISTREEKAEYIICVEDNGIGFDASELTKALHDPSVSKRSHVGMMSVMSRIDLMCHGTLEVNSTRGVGTLMTIHIPKNTED